MKYQIFCLETFEFLYERIVEIEKEFEGIYYTQTEYRYFLSSDIPKNVESYSDAKLVTFLSLKKAEKWIKNYCEENKYSSTLFEIVKADG